MQKWTIARRLIPATELGTGYPFIPQPLHVEAMYFVREDGFHVFYNDELAPVFEIASDSIMDLRREDAIVSEGADDRT